MRRGKNFYSSIVDGIKDEELLTTISKRLGISKQNLNYYLPTLEEGGFIKKDEFGRWVYLADYEEKTVKKTTGIGKKHLQIVKKDKEVRGHAIQIKLLLPENYRNWENRRKVFDYISLKWTPHFIGGIERGEMSVMEDLKIHFYNKSIVFNFDEKDFKEETARLSSKAAINSFLRAVKRLERTFYNSPLGEHGRYKFKITRQHYALVKNALASQYISEDKKLHVYTGKGLWLLIDNSFNLEELETVHPETAVEDNEKVQTHFNQIKEADLGTIKETSPENVKKELVNLKGVFPAMSEYNENLKLHTTVQLENKELLKLNQDLAKEQLITLRMIQEQLKGGKS